MPKMPKMPKIKDVNHYGIVLLLFPFIEFRREQRQDFLPAQAV